MKVRVTEGSGLDSGKAGTIVPKQRVPTDHRGIPKLPGRYKPVNWREEHAVLLDDGVLTTMFKTRLEVI